jgi:glycosyltransferase involved in cell wall biosynthesis
VTVLLSAALIVRDEATMLGDCLRSLRGLVDEILVVDTGSTDGTPDLAAGLGARIVTFPWQGDFAAARNEALARARGRWILYIDADERIGPVPPAERDRLLSDDSVVAYTVRFRPRSGFTRYREHRIFRNDPRIRFR